MNRSARTFIVVVAGFLWVATLPIAAAAGYDSSSDALIRGLSDKLIVLAVAVALIVEAALLYVVVRYRNSGDARETEYNPRFLATWALAIGVILLFVGVASLQTMIALDRQGTNPPPEDAVRVDVVAQQWAWAFEYTQANVTSYRTLVVPANETVYLRITSRDVIHSFHAPDLGVKQDANPAQWNSVTFTPTATGEYRVFCAEYCGRGHSRMLATIRVVSSAEYADWLDEQRSNSAGN